MLEQFERARQDYTNREYARQQQQQSKLSKRQPHWINKVAEGTLCSIFTFLDVYAHHNLSSSCVKMQKISIRPQASPTQIDIPNLMHSTSFISNPREIRKKIVNRMMSFRPLRLIVPSAICVAGEFIELKEIAEMTSLRELIVCEDLSATYRLEPNVEWISKLTRLTKLTIPEESLLTTTPLPSSLTQLELLKSSYRGFSYCSSKSTARLKSPHLQALQELRVLKLPNDNYCGEEILSIGKILPHLRELSLGYLYVRNGIPSSLTELESCKHLETLSLGVDSNESIGRWETLSAIPSLRRLTISVYQVHNPPNLFEGLSKVTQLTHLALVPYHGRKGIDISSAISNLFATNTPAVISTETSAALTTLLISNYLVVSDVTSLSAFSTLEELQLPSTSTSTKSTLSDLSGLLRFPRLHTLHVTKNQTDLHHLLSHYKDQLVTLFYKDPMGTIDGATSEMLGTLLQMKKLRTLKLRSCRFITPDANSGLPILSVSKYFRQNLPSTVEIEMDDSAENATWFQ